MAAPSMTFGAAGNLRASASLTNAGGPATHDFDLSGKVEGQVTIVNTPTGGLSTTRGLRVEFLSRYGSAPGVTTLPVYVYDFPSQALAPESKTFFLGTGRWRLRLTNMDTGNAVTVEATLDTVDGIG